LQFLAPKKSFAPLNFEKNFTPLEKFTLLKMQKKLCTPENMQKKLCTKNFAKKFYTPEKMQKNFTPLKICKNLHP